MKYKDYLNKIEEIGKHYINLARKNGNWEYHNTMYLQERDNIIHEYTIDNPACAVEYRELGLATRATVAGEFYRVFPGTLKNDLFEIVDNIPGGAL